MCRAIRVLCVAGDAGRLAELKRASVGAGWELAPGATSQEDALAELDGARAHILVVDGDFPGLPSAALQRFPGLRVIMVDGVSAVADEQPRAKSGSGSGSGSGAQESDFVRVSLGQVREAILGLPRPGGPVRAG
jgi:hypothetical protein